MKVFLNRRRTLYSTSPIPEHKDVAKIPGNKQQEWRRPKSRAWRNYSHGNPKLRPYHRSNRWKISPFWYYVPGENSNSNTMSLPRPSYSSTYNPTSTWKCSSTLLFFFRCPLFFCKASSPISLDIPNSPCFILIDSWRSLYRSSICLRSLRLSRRRCVSRLYRCGVSAQLFRG